MENIQNIAKDLEECKELSTRGRKSLEKLQSSMFMN